MHLKQLRTFIAIADTGSFHAAAEKMCVTQSAVSMQMKNLEESLQLELFERSVRPPRLSNAGMLLLDQAREIVDLYEKLLLSTPVSGQFSGSIRIGTIPGVSFILPDTLAQLRDRFRQFQVRVFSALTDELINQVLQGRLDAAIISQPLALDPQLLGRVILTEPLVVIAPKDQEGLSDIELLTRNHLISFNRKAEVSRNIEEILKKRNIVVDPIMEIDTLETFQMMVVRGLGVGILPYASVSDHFKEAFYIVPFGSPAVQRRVTLIQHRRHHRQHFLDTLYDALCLVARKGPAAPFRTGEAGNAET